MSTSTLSALSITSVPADWLIIGGAIVVLILIAMYAGSSNVISLALGSLVASSLLPLVPNTVFLSSINTSSDTTMAAVFFAMMFPLTFIFRWMTSDVLGITTPIQAIIAGVAGAAMLLLVWTQTPVLTALWDFGGLIDLIFTEPYRLWVILASLLILSFSKA
mgnify:FL=1